MASRRLQCRMPLQEARCTALGLHDVMMGIVYHEVPFVYIIVMYVR